MPRTTRRLEHEDGRFIEVFLPQMLTTSEMPETVFESPNDLPENIILEIEVKALVRAANSNAVGTFYKRGLYSRAMGGNLRLVTNAFTEYLGELSPADVEIEFGVAGQRFTITARGKAATTYTWSMMLFVLRNNP